MKTKIIAPIAATISAGAASAGSVAYNPVVESVIVEDSPMGSGSGAWLIPLLVIALIALVASNSNSNSTTTTIVSTL